MNYLYKCPDIEAIPAGKKYRILCDTTDLRIIQTDTPLPIEWETYPDTYPNGISVVDGCIAEWHDRDKELAEIDAEIERRVDLITDAAFKWPEKTSAKLKARNDKATTEGLLKADGADIQIIVNGNWKK